jgi:hypothetical protein
MFRNAARIAALCAAALLLSGCGSISSFLAPIMADHLPAWAGGLPEGAPPRPGDPRYQEYIEQQKAKALPDDGKKGPENKDPITGPIY